MGALKFANLGLGDITIFAATMLLDGNHAGTLYVTVCKELIKKYAVSNESIKYSLEFMSFLLPEMTIVITQDQSYPLFDPLSRINLEKFRDAISDEKVRKHFQKLFQKPRIYPDEYVVLVSKTRDYPISLLQAFEHKLFEALNGLNTKFVIIGEQKILDTVEYSIHGPNLVYSNYERFISNLRPELVIDATVPYISNTSGFDQIIHDMSIVFNSRFTVAIGGGGFFCMSLLSGKLKALHDPYHVSTLFSEHNKRQIFTTPHDFISAIMRENEA